MSGGGKGGTTTTEVRIPEWLEAAARGNIGRAESVAGLGYTPYYGPDVAAMTPMQTAAGQGINTAAGAFGLGTTDLSMGMPAPQTFAGGVQGYSSGGLYDEALAELQRRAPGQYNAMTGMFINPITGQMPAGATASGGAGASAGANSTVPTTQRQEGGAGDRAAALASRQSGDRGNPGTTSIATPASFAPGGVNTRNPNSAVNRVAAALSGPQSAPTQANRPISRSTAPQGRAGGGMGRGKA